jgi:hypothetical protein
MLGFRDSGTGQFTGPARGTGTEPGLPYRACWGLALLISRLNHLVADLSQFLAVLIRV